jgi:DNA-directed RNA polymerase subunit alpha
MRARHTVGAAAVVAERPHVLAIFTTFVCPLVDSWSKRRSHGREPMPRIPYISLTRTDGMADRLEMSTAEIGLSVRTTNCLEERGIFTVHDLLQCTRADLLSIANFGEKTLEEVYRSLEKIGFSRQSGSEITVGSVVPSERPVGG